MARKLPGNDIENDNQFSPPLSPKRSFAQDHLDPIDIKRRHVLSEGEGGLVRTPLDPLPLSGMENIVNGDIGPDMHISLSTSTSLPDLRFTPSQRKTRGQPCSATGKSTAGPVCSWPPSASQGGSVPPNCKPKRHGSENDILHSSDARVSFRATISRSTSSSPLSENSQPATMSDNTRSQGRSERTAQPIRLCSNSLPQIRCPSGELWQAATPPVHEPAVVSDPVRTVYGQFDDSNGIPSSPLFPPGLSPYPSELRRCGSDTDLLTLGSASSFLASGSQPLQASEQANPVAPIGAERSRVLRMISSRPVENKSKPPLTEKTTNASDPSAYLWYPPMHSPKLRSKLRSLVLRGGEDTADIPPESRFTPPISQDDFHRLMRQTTNNRFASRVISPLSPLRTPAPSFTLTTDPAYQARMPSLTNILSLRYTKGPVMRSRTMCDIYQPSHPEESCTHCQECKRDSVGKRFMAFKYRQQFQYRLRSYGRSFTLPPPTRNALDMLGEDFCDERSLWDEVADATSAEPFPRSGSAVVVGSNGGCAVGNGVPPSPRLQDIHLFEDADFPETPDGDMLLANVPSFRELTVY
ncbi:hypothetical protein J3A83DRAFT_4376698 [Scleroderma citrinum]